MKTNKYESWRRRPESATIEKLAEYRAKGLSFGEIGKLWGISRSAVWQLYQKHKSEVDRLVERLIKPVSKGYGPERTGP